MQSARIILKESRGDAYGLALLGLVANHPASDFDTKHALELALVDLGFDPHDQYVLTGMEKGKTLDVDETVDQLLARLA